MLSINIYPAEMKAVSVFSSMSWQESVNKCIWFFGSTLVAANGCTSVK